MGAGVFYPQRSVFPKRVGSGGGGGINPATVTFDNDPTALIGGTFSPLAANQLARNQQVFPKTGAGTVRRTAISAPLALAPNTDFGNFVFANNTAIQCNFSNTLVGFLVSTTNIAVTKSIISYSIDGAGNAAGFEVEALLQIGLDAPNTLLVINSYSYNTGARVLIKTDTYPLTLSGENKVAIYADINTNLVGTVIDGVDNGPIQVGGINHVFSFGANFGFLSQQYISGAGDIAAADNGQYVAANLCLQENEITEPVPAGYFDSGNNPI